MGKRHIILEIGIVFALALLVSGPSEAYTQVAASAYGEKQPVETEERAREVMLKYFEEKGREVEAGEVEERELYFEVEVLDTSGEVVDEVLIDKRSGRVRSIY